MNTQISTLTRGSHTAENRCQVSHNRVILSGNCATSICLLKAGSASFPVLVDARGRAIKYIHDDSFLNPSAEAEFLTAPKVAKRKTRRKADIPDKAGSYLAHLWSVPLLSRNEESHYFRMLHFLRFQSAKLQIEMSTCRAHIGLLKQLEFKLQQMDTVRKLLIESNLRLVVSIAKKYARGNLTFDELVSVGNTALVNAVDQFDYRRGYRFSTYAYRAIQRSMFGALRTEHRNVTRFSVDGDEATQYLAKDASFSDVAELQAAEARSEVQQLLGLLDPREQMIVMTRFGMSEGSEPSSFRKIGGAIGLSKQRVASIFSEALAKIRKAISRRKASSSRD